VSTPRSIHWGLVVDALQFAMDYFLVHLHTLVGPLQFSRVNGVVEHAGTNTAQGGAVIVGGRADSRVDLQ